MTEQTKVPVPFVGHGNPLNAIEDSEFTRARIEAGKALPKPRIILRISASTAEHYIPLLYSLALEDEGGPVSFFAEKVRGGSVSMRSVQIG